MACSIFLAAPLYIISVLNIHYQHRFHKAQGTVLCVRLMNALKYAAALALKSCDLACRNHRDNTKQLIDQKGLAPIFTFFMCKGLSKKALRAVEEHIVSLIETLCRYAEGDHIARVLNKFTENKFEKLERLLELHSELSERLNAGMEARRDPNTGEDMRIRVLRDGLIEEAELAIADENEKIEQENERRREEKDKRNASSSSKRKSRSRSRSREGEHGLEPLKLRTIDEGKIETDLNDRLYLARCEDGLSTLQRVDLCILRLLNMGNRNIASAMKVLFDVKGVKKNDILATIMEYIDHLDDNALGDAEKRELKKFVKNVQKGI
jgi:hypothetical protein